MIDSDLSGLRSKRSSSLSSISSIQGGFISTITTTEKPHKNAKFSQGITAWSYHMEGRDENCVERYFELAFKCTSALKLAETLCMDGHPCVPEDFNITGELASECAQIVLKCLASIGSPDLFWTVNVLARSVTKWNKARDKRLISYINHAQQYRQYC